MNDIQYYIDKFGIEALDKLLNYATDSSYLFKYDFYERHYILYGVLAVSITILIASFIFEYKNKRSIKESIDNAVFIIGMLILLSFATFLFYVINVYASTSLDDTINKQKDAINKNINNLIIHSQPAINVNDYEICLAHNNNEDDKIFVKIKCYLDTQADKEMLEQNIIRTKVALSTLKSELNELKSSERDELKAQE